jgi:hypothetical protein
MNVKRRKEILRTRLAEKKEIVAVEEVKIEVPAPVVVEEPKKKITVAKKVEEKPAEEKVVAPVAE